MANQTLDITHVPMMLTVSEHDETETGECVEKSILEMAGDHPLACYAREVADAIQISRDSTFIIGLGLASAIVSTVYNTSLRVGMKIPVGLYTVAEQPPGTGKSGVMRAFETPFRKALTGLNKQRAEDKRKLEDKRAKTEDLEERERLDYAVKMTPEKLAGWISNTTAEGLEKEVLIPNSGLFMLASDEQGLVNSIFGLSYGKAGTPPNLDAALQGFDGGFSSTLRSGREGYAGQAHGSVVCFAQSNTIESIIRASGGTGLAERFLWRSDKHRLGERNHMQKYVKPNAEKYEQLCREIIKLIPDTTSIENLTTIDLPAALLDELNQAKQKIEPELADGGRYGSNVVRGAAGKFDLQVVKIATVLHVTRHLCAGERVPSNINRADFVIAMEICHEQLESYLDTLIQKRIVGISAECDAVIEHLEKHPNGKDSRAVKNSLRSRAIFAGRGTKPIGDAIAKLKSAGMIIGIGGATGKEKIKLA